MGCPGPWGYPGVRQTAARQACWGNSSPWQMYLLKIGMDLWSVCWTITRSSTTAAAGLVGRPVKPSRHFGRAELYPRGEAPEPVPIGTSTALIGG